MVNGKKKGNAGELELANYLTASGMPFRRIVQFCGAAEGDPDIIPKEDVRKNTPELYKLLDRFHWECKRVEAFSLYTGIEQAINDSSRTGRTPLVLHRRNNKPWVTILLLDDFINLIKEIYAYKDEKSCEKTCCEESSES